MAEQDSVQKRYLTREETLELMGKVIMKLINSGKKYRAIIVPVRGALGLGYEVITALGDSVHFQALQISSYKDGVKIKEPEIPKRSLESARAGLDGLDPQEILLIDDIFDSGGTKHLVTKEFGLVDTLFLMLRWSKDEEHATFVGEVLDNDDWIVFIDEEWLISVKGEEVRLMARPYRNKKD